MTEEEIKKELKKCERTLIFIQYMTPTSLFLLFVYADVVDDTVNWFEICNMDNFLSLTGEILSAVIGLSIPLALNVVQMIQSRNKTSRLTRDFIAEPIYKAQVRLFFANLIVLIPLSLFGWQGWWFRILCISIFVTSMIYLGFFIKLIHTYVSNLDHYLLEKYDQEIDSFFKRR